MKYLETFNDFSHICPPVDHIKKARDKKAMAELEREREEAEKEMEKELEQEEERKRIMGY
ncbi:hypothetical protein [Edaphocola aurantiacus]|uniref:hypothetical protein n=1 Tax=Edaphocola aurantiacus TaxID=2601682 RepID=UPI001C95B0C6|nr:hypothetical protein [Edaphocola aurantiacus]